MPCKREFMSTGLGLLCLAAARPVAAAEGIALSPVDGLAYGADGERLLVPGLQGLAVFAAGRWSRSAGPAHVHKHLAATARALYSSGRPAPGSGEPDPLGLIASSDGGLSWDRLGLEGEANFRELAAGHRNGAIYVVSSSANSRMLQPGMHFTLDDGRHWRHAAGRGLGSAVRRLAVHPDDPRIVAAGTSDGLYLSHDSAGQFTRIVGRMQVLAQAFDLDGRQLWFSAHDGSPSLQRIALEPGARAERLPLPALPGDAVARLAHNPVRRGEVAIASFERQVFVSGDGGRHWQAIAEHGLGRQPPRR